MRRSIPVLTSLLLAATLLGGCAEDSDPQSDDVKVGTDPSASAAPSADPSVPATGEEKNGTPDPTGTPQPKANVAPVAELTSDVTEGTVPFDVVFEFAADDEDGDELSWTLDVDGDGAAETEGTSLPANFTYTFDTAGNYTAVLSVTDGEEAVNKTLEIAATAASESGEIVQTIEGSWMAGVFGCEALTIRPTGSGSIYEDSFVFVGDVVAEAAGRSFHAEFETTTPEADVIQLDFLDADFSNLARWSSTGGAPVDETVPDGAVYVLVASCTGLDGSTTITIG